LLDGSRHRKFQDGLNLGDLRFDSIMGKNKTQELSFSCTEGGLFCVDLKVVLCESV